jgi:UDP-2,4-diacetamido-2,4,6-trideoxy-beta-L-altropyranose hydrolase
MTQQSPVVVLRADANSTIGAGHIMRSLTLGAALVEHGSHVHLFSVALAPAFAQRADEAGITVVSVSSAEAESEIASRVHELSPDVLVVDGYHLAPFITSARSLGLHVAVFDDDHSMDLDDVQVVINDNLDAKADAYGSSAGQRVLAGPQYSLIRSDVRALIPQRSTTIPSDARVWVLVTMGGGVAQNLVLPITTALLTAGSVRVCAALQADHHDRAQLERLAHEHPDALHIDRGDLLDSYERASLAVCAGGVTMLECIALGIVPVAITVATNQIPAVGALRALDLGIVGPSTLERDADVVAQTVLDAVNAALADMGVLAAMSDRGRRIIDGCGSERLAAELLRSC